MKKFLLPEGGQFYKANMHCHSTVSDGRLTSEALKEAYKKEGYSIIAFTDHNRCISRSSLTDSSFLALSAYEIDISDRNERDTDFTRCYHLNAYSKKEEPAFESLLPLPAYGDIEAINNFISDLNDAGFLVCYNHPNWSLQNAFDYRGLKGIFALEIYNHSAALDGIDGNQIIPYDILLREGNRIFCIAADDNHDNFPIGHPKNDSFGGFIMIKADSLDYKTIINALEAGSFYASMGPEIKQLYVEDGKLFIECSDVRSICMTTAGRRAGTEQAPKEGTINSASFEILPKDRYVRIQITDSSGLRANTNAYFVEDIL
jgi:hypothetical protein